MLILTSITTKASTALYYILMVVADADYKFLYVDVGGRGWCIGWRNME